MLEVFFTFALAWVRGRIVRILLAFVLVGFLVWLVDLKQALTLLKATDWRWIALAVLAVQMQVVLSAWRWQITAVRLGQQLSISRAIGEYYLATVANLSLPGGVTGDAARVYRNRKGHEWETVAQAVILERLAGQLALFIVVIVGWLLWIVFADSPAPMQTGRLILITTFVFVFVAILMVLLIRFAAPRITQFIVSFGPAMHRAWLADRQWLVQSGLSFAVVATYLAVFACSAYALDQPIPTVALVTIVPLVLLSMVLPLSIGGWGVREATAATLWPLAGLSSEAGIATSIVYGLVSLLGALPGVWVLVAARYSESRV